jgi:hypothetical protein
MKIAMVSSNVLNEHLPGETEENHKKLSGQSVPGPELKLLRSLRYEARMVSIKILRSCTTRFIQSEKCNFECELY